MMNFDNLSDAELKTHLKEYGFSCGPVTRTTRKVYEKQLSEYKILYDLFHVVFISCCFLKVLLSIVASLELEVIGYLDSNLYL